MSKTTTSDDEYIQTGDGGGGGASGEKDGSRPAAGGGGGGKGTGVDGSTSRTADGDIQPKGKLGAVKDQAEFDEKMTALVKDIDREFDLAGLVPIFMVRRASNLDRATFDKYMGGMVRSGKAETYSGGMYPSNQSIGKIPPANPAQRATASLRDPINLNRVNDGWKTPLGNDRYTVRVSF